MQAFNAKAEECIVFEDSLVGIKAAKNAGLKTVAIYDKYSNNDIEEIKQQADFFINNYAELLSIIENL